MSADWGNDFFDELEKRNKEKVDKMNNDIMKGCTQCPHVVGDYTERDCGFPDCMGGWEAVYKQQVNTIEELQKENKLSKAQLQSAQNSFGESMEKASNKITKLEAAVDMTLSAIHANPDLHQEFAKTDHTALMELMAISELGDSNAPESVWPLNDSVDADGGSD
jgi:hypothetical protein